MNFHFEAFVRYPLAAVYRVYRDDLTRIGRSVENIERIELLSRTEIQGGAEITHLWNGRGFIPVVARPLISSDMLLMDSWTVWHDAEHYSDWTVAPRHFADCGRCGGELRFEAAGPSLTRIVMSGELEIKLDSLSVVPKFLRAFVEEQVARFLLALGEPNHLGVARRSTEYLDEHVELWETPVAAPPSSTRAVYEDGRHSRD